MDHSYLRAITVGVDRESAERVLEILRDVHVEVYGKNEDGAFELLADNAQLEQNGTQMKVAGKQTTSDNVGEPTAEADVCNELGDAVDTRNELSNEVSTCKTLGGDDDATCQRDSIVLYVPAADEDHARNAICEGNLADLLCEKSAKVDVAESEFEKATREYARRRKYRIMECLIVIVAFLIYIVAKQLM